MSTKKQTRSKLSPDQIRGQLATFQSDLGKLEREHAEMAQQFQEKVAANQKRHAELTGGIAALQALLN
jgi:hypothetical protein